MPDASVSLDGNEDSSEADDYLGVGQSQEPNVADDEDDEVDEEVVEEDDDEDNNDEAQAEFKDIEQEHLSNRRESKEHNDKHGNLSASNMSRLSSDATPPSNASGSSGSGGIMKLKIQLKAQPDEKSKVYRIV